MSFNDKLKDKKELIKALLQYDSLVYNPNMLAKALLEYNIIKASYPFGDLDRKYHAMTYMPTNDNKNDIRHIYTNANLVQQFPEEFVRDLGLFKEDADLIDFKPISDTFGDYINNEKGMAIGKKYPFAPNEILFNETLMESGLPLTPRNNKLYGYVDNLPDGGIPIEEDVSSELAKELLRQMSD